MWTEHKAILVRAQKNANNLILSYRRGKRYYVCVVPWPLRPDGSKLPPNEVQEWLRSRGLAWTCACSTPRGMGLVAFHTSEDGTVTAQCQYSCPFFLNLSQIYERTSFTASMDYFRVGQTEWLYNKNCSQHSSFEPVNGDVDSGEATYYGWCGEYDWRVEM